MYLNALQVRERVLGQEHPSTAESLENLACLYLDEGDTGQARRFAERAGQGREKVLATVLSFTSEAQRLAFRDSRNPYDLLATVGSAPHIAQTLLRQKGVVLDSMMEDAMLVKEGSDPEFDGRVRQVRTAKQHLLDLLVGSPRNLSEEGLKQRAIQREQLQEQVDEMERGLARDLSGLGRTRRALAVTTEQVQSQLPATGELVEFVTYEHFLGNHEWEGRYGAVLLSRDADPVWIPLGPAKAINANVRLCQSIVRGEASADQLQRVLQDLHTQAWAPIEARLPSGTQTVVLGPDGALNFVSFATLVAPNGEFVAEKYLVQYVSSGRDLLVAAGKPVDRVGQGIVVFANPQYDSRPAETDTAQVPVRGVPSRLASASDLRDLGFPPLPSTAKEGTVLAGLARDAGWPVTVYSGSEASKGKLYQTRGARILHFATHGFFLPDQSANSPPRNQLRDADVLGLRDLPRADRVNPMYRSGLAFAGAQVTADAWRQGKEVPAEVNGILTAAEVSTLDLRGTWLVVLSACDTGSGDSLPGEGVLGLRRGFVQAGAQNLLMTLWPVLDEESAQFMGDFYGRILKQNISPARALAETQREWLKRLRGEQGLLHAVRVAGPFVLTSQGGL